MAKATRTCPRCTTETMTFVAQNRKEAERYADWKVENGALCDACTSAQREEQSLKAANEAADKGLPTLHGTEKQVPWAETIRAELLGIAEKLANAVTLLQAEDRLHRPGQTRNVGYVDIWAKCGIEERIERALSRKGSALDEFRKELDAARHNGKGAVETLLRSL